MLGIAFYSALAFGLGLLVPLGKAGGSHSIGIRFTAGAALLILALYVTMVLLALPLYLSVILVGGLSATGWISSMLLSRTPNTCEAILHPAFVLPVSAALVTTVYGPVDYLPYTVDEFTNWIGVSRIIHWAGSFEAVRESVHLPGYTPGWRLLLLAPWQITGAIDHGQSAAAPLVLHVAALSLLYDVTAVFIRRDGSLSLATTRSLAWLILLIFLGAESMGRLWTFEMLIEQPQIYMLSAAVLLILSAELTPSALRPSYAIAGIVLAAGFLLKNAVLATAPAALAVVFLSLALSRGPIPDRLREGVVRSALLLLPLAITMLSWTIVGSSTSCLSSPVSVFTTGKDASYDAIDLARRFSHAVGAYVLYYKLPVTLAATVGLALGLYLRLWHATLFSVAFAGVYLISLYWYHLGCFGDYYYQELNSIPRFSRVPIQVLHMLGLLLLAAGIVRFGIAQRPDLIARRSVALACLVVALSLTAWQIRQTYRTITDLTTRAHQNVDPRIDEMRQAAAFVERHVGQLLPAHPSLAVLSQGQDGDVRRYAEYFARRPGNGGSLPIFTVHNNSSWAPAPANVWQSAVAPGTLAKELGSLDLLWPIQVDAWLVNELRELVPDATCLERLPHAALIRDHGPPAPLFICRAKDQ